MEEQIFCDGIGRIAIIGGVVRLDLFTYSPSETDANGNPRPVLSHRIVMGTEGFLRSAEKVVEAVQAITRNRAQPQPTRPQGPQWPPQATQTAPPPPPQATQSAPPPQQPAPQPAPQPATKTVEPPPPTRPPFP